MTTQAEREQAQAKEYLLETGITPGDTVYTILKHVSRSGMYRVVDVYLIKENKPIRLSWNTSKLIGRYDRNHEGVGIGGCGMDMGFSIVYELSYILFGDGYALKHSWM